MLDKNKIIGLPVYTQADIYLGEVSEIKEVDQTVYQYLVNPTNPIKKILTGQLIINANQVVSITEEKMVVEDNWQKIIDPNPVPSL